MLSPRFAVEMIEFRGNRRKRKSDSRTNFENLKFKMKLLDCTKIKSKLN